MANAAPVRIEPVPSTYRATALRFLWEQAGPLEPIKWEPDLSAWHEPFAGEFLIWARRGEQILAASWVIPTARGRSLQVTLPRCAIDAPADLLEQMLQHLLARMQQDRRAHVAQTLIDPAAAALRRAAQKIGFRHGANLAWYTCMPQLRGQTRFDLRLVRYECDARTQLLTVLAGTYQDSNDCPVLAGLLEPADYLAEYELRCGDADRDWYFVQLGEEIIGCLLMCGLKRAEEESVELLYWGLIPEARGRRFGTNVLRLVNDRAANSGKVVVACVDEGNLAACRAFRQGGFTVSHRQQLYICPLAAERSVTDFPFEPTP